MREGHIVFSPISHSHPIAVQCDLPKGWDFWHEFDKAFIEWADEVYILKKSGWKESIGVQAEIKIAKSLNKPVKLWWFTNYEL